MNVNTLPPALAQPLGRRLVLATLSFCLLFSLATVALRSWHAWANGLATMDSELALIDQVFQGPLAKAIWELDHDNLDTQLDSAAQAAPVGRLLLNIPRPGRADEVIERRREGFSAVGPAPVLVRELAVAPYPGAREVVGSLTLEGDPALLRRRLWREMVSILLTQLVQSLALAGLIMAMFNRLVTVHVKHIARHLGELGPDNLGQRLRLARPKRRNDELDLLEGRINALQANMAEYLERHRLAEQALASNRDQLAEQVAQRTAELREANQRLERLARHDPLTGLANRRQFDEIKEQEFRRAIRGGLPLAVLMCDVDFFKRYNDTYGHAHGDDCLRQVAHLLAQHFSGTGEVVARLGGEEFAVLLPGTNVEQARQAAERLRESLAQRRLPHTGSPISPWVTMSIGIAQFDVELASFDQLLQRADHALYRAKGAGRDRVGQWPG
ncbi:diguanylate cyclase domain-containing protein [Pseudomonas typographi]|uniref:diguanylate cyclase domain-containing protein n=1 Tax=Pseudomonas typographi TaxID=2715964 RepID=UPI001684F660|nr:diguanylate cyclase [Pseudomonas typographi]MBD1554182.1 diguanylate cyclase [Pseudomonas typographi]